MNSGPSYRLIHDQSYSSFIIKEEPFDLGTQWHYHPEIEIMFFEKGKVSGIMGNRFFNFKSGDLVLLGTNFPHVIFDSQNNSRSPGTPYGAIIQFRQDFLGEKFFKVPELKGVQKLLLKSKNGIYFKNNQLGDISDLITGISTRNSSRQLLDLLEILTSLSEVKDVEFLSIDSEYNRSELDEDRMQRIKEYIYADFKNDVKIAELASLVNMTETSLCRYYKSRTLKTLTQTLNEIRISYACQLLKSTNQSVTDTGYESGFNSPAYFSRMFKKIVGVSPSQYKTETDPKILRW